MNLAERSHRVTPTQTVSVEFEDGSSHTFTVLAEPPGHLVFLSHDANSVSERLNDLALLGGLASLFVVEFDGHTVDQAELPRSIDALRLRGQQFNAWLDQKSGVDNCVLALKSLVVSTIEAQRSSLSGYAKSLPTALQPAIDALVNSFRPQMDQIIEQSLNLQFPLSDLTSFVESCRGLSPSWTGPSLDRFKTNSVESEDWALKLRENLRSMIREIVVEEIERALDSRR